MTTIEMARAKAESVSGYSYNRQTLESICNAGFTAIPEGSLIAANGDQRVTLESGALVCRKGDVVTKTTQAAGDAMREQQALVMYAVRASQLGVRVG
jgi:hypothetical protein